MSIAASALSCALEVREAQVAPEPAAEHDDAAASLSSCETAAFGVQVRLRQRRLGGRRPRRRCYLVGTRDGSPPPCGCGPSVLFVGTLYFLLTKSTVSQQKVQRPEKSTDQKGKRHIYIDIYIDMDAVYPR